MINVIILGHKFV